MKAIELEAKPREARKRNQVKALRSEGAVPGVLYGTGEPTQVQVDDREFTKLLKNSSSETVLLDLTVGDQKHLALVQEVQIHPLSRQRLHIDFREVKPDQAVVVTLPIITEGEPIGVKTGGGNMDQVLRFVKVKGTPAALPEELIVNVEHLDIGQTLHVSEMKTPEGIEVLANEGNPVVSIAKPRVMVETTATAEGEEGAEGEAAEGEGAAEGAGDDAKPAEEGGD